MLSLQLAVLASPEPVHSACSTAVSCGGHLKPPPHQGLQAWLHSAHWESLSTRCAYEHKLSGGPKRNLVISRPSLSGKGGRQRRVGPMCSAKRAHVNSGNLPMWASSHTRHQVPALKQRCEARPSSRLYNAEGEDMNTERVTRGEGWGSGTKNGPGPVKASPPGAGRSTRGRRVAVSALLWLARLLKRACI